LIRLFRNAAWDTARTCCRRPDLLFQDVVPESRTFRWNSTTSWLPGVSPRCWLFIGRSPFTRN
jgi:hypothetical protein